MLKLLVPCQFLDWLPYVAAVVLRRLRWICVSPNGSLGRVLRVFTWRERVILPWVLYKEYFMFWWSWYLDTTDVMMTVDRGTNRGDYVFGRTKVWFFWLMQLQLLHERCRWLVYPRVGALGWPHGPHEPGHPSIRLFNYHVLVIDQRRFQKEGVAHIAFLLVGELYPVSNFYTASWKKLSLHAAIHTISSTPCTTLPLTTGFDVPPWVCSGNIQVGTSNEAYVWSKGGIFQF